MQLYAQGYQGDATLTAQACSGRVCRHPERSELFLIGDVGATCPGAQSLQWLSETPFEAPIADTFVVERVAAPRTLGGEHVSDVRGVEVGPVISTSRKS